MEQKRKGPKRGAAKKWAERLKELRQQPASKNLVNILNRTEKPKKVASPRPSDRDAEA